MTWIKFWRSDFAERLARFLQFEFPASRHGAARDILDAGVVALVVIVVRHFLVLCVAL